LNVVNFLFGLTPIPLPHYALGTLIGIVPGTLAYTWLGASGVEALSGGDRWSLAIVLSLFALLSPPSFVPSAELFGGLTTCVLFNSLL